LCFFCHIFDRAGAARIERCAIPDAQSNVARVIVRAASRQRTTQL
jgi:hypothetical protein